jgi:flagellar hook-associated protein 1 FlgK
MSDLLSTGVSGLLAFQSALDTISNNISNVNTPGYSKENAQLSTTTATPTAQGWVGNGVAVSSVTRAYSNFLDAQTQSATSSYNQFNTLSSLADSINNMLGDSSTGLSATLQSFSQAIQSMANAPTQNATRQGVLTQAQSLISQFQSYQGTFTQLTGRVNTQLQTEASTITSLGQSIAGLNQQIMAAQANGTSQPPNQLLDERNHLIDQLSSDVGVSTVTQSDGSISVFIGTGQTLVLGGNAATLSAGSDPFNSGQIDLALQTSSGSTDITNSLTGGTVGGLLQFREQMLIPGQNALGQAAVALTTLVNTQNQAGLDQNGNIGQALLGVGGPAVLPSLENTGTATVSAAVTTLSGLSTSNYYLQYAGPSAGGAWSLIDTATGASTALTASTAAGVTTLTGGPGITLTVTGTAQAGDRFLVQPTGQAVAGLSLLTTDPTRIAAAGPLVSGTAAANTGSGSISAATVPNTAAWTRGNYTISFSSTSAYTITNAGGSTVASGTYTAGVPIAFNGIDVTLIGSPASGDSFTIDDNANGTGDNTNALALAGILNQNVLAGGAASLSGVVSAYVGTVGEQTSQAQNGVTAQQTVMSSAQNAQSSVSGVNLDEEAANMVQYQQAYQAAAQVIQASNTLFQSLISAINATG